MRRKPKKLSISIKNNLKKPKNKLKHDSFNSLLIKKQNNNLIGILIKKLLNKNTMSVTIKQKNKNKK